jgi:Methylase involved in ubiquinone/menaquinone biosynthesis
MTVEEIFRLAHTDLPREAPGSAATTRLLLRLAAPLPPRPRIVDIGCGTGPASLLLAAETGGEVVAVDTHEPFLQRLRAAAGPRVRTLHADMQDLPLSDAGADLLWAEGSASVMGVDAALTAWRRLLVPGGALVLTDATWTTPDPAPAARAFWDAAYPAMRTPDAVIVAAQRAGWVLLGSHLLPDADWAAYYDPLAARIARLRAELPDHGELLDEWGTRSRSAAATAPTTATRRSCCAGATHERIRNCRGAALASPP